MAFRAPAAGKLVAVDGVSGPEVAALAKRVLPPEAAAAAGTSLWDASNVFAELKLDDPSIPGLSPRSLLLCYAADLAFRLRWEIRPALEEGRTVVAAPYVSTAIAFGRVTGLPRRWMLELFSMAPRPLVAHVAPADAPPEAPPRGGFIEFCCAMLERGNPPWDAAVLRARIAEYLRVAPVRAGALARR